MGVFAELRRRNVFKVAMFYLVASWLVLQVADLIFDLLGFPEIWLRLVAVLLALGLPLALTFSWIFELTPDGLKREASIDRAQPRDGAVGHRLNLATIAVVLLGLGVLLTDRLLLDHPSTPSATTMDLVEKGLVEAAIPIIAVLPFTASGSDDGGFLARGLHDDLLTRLAKLDTFRVISRTSMMEYAATTKNMREIGAELGAGYILEGGVQARGERIRVNAQLIDAANDEHLWADTYDRKLTAVDLFDIQAELAAAIAGELRLTLSAPDQALIKQIPTENIEAYNAYLRGLSIRDTGHNSSTAARAIAAFEQAVELDPEFALGWAQLSIELSRYSQITRSDDTRAAAIAARDRAAALEPNLVEIKLADAVYLYRALFEYEQSLEALEVLATQTPLNASQLILKAFIQRRLGRYQAAYENALAAHTLDPRSVTIAGYLVTMAWESGDCVASRRHARAALALAPNEPDVRASAADYEMQCNGDGVRATELIRGFETTDGWHLGLAVGAALMTGDFQRLLELADFEDVTFFTASSALLKAEAQLGLGQQEAARASLEAAESALAAAETADPHAIDDPLFQMGKIAFHSLSGDAEETGLWVERHRRSIRELLKGNVPFEQFNRVIYAESLLRVGLADAAVREIRHVLENPGGRTFLAFDVDQRFAPLKDHPGYAELRQRYGGKARVDSGS